MSDGSNTKINSEPFTNIGASDLQKVAPPTKCGLIRKRGKLDRMLGKSLKIKWKVKFVVISQGCVYCFNSGGSKAPQSAFSLSIYDKVQDYKSNYVKFCFEVVHEIPTQPSHVFSCETEDSKNEWMAAFNYELEQAHMHSGNQLSAGSVGSNDSGIGMRPTRKLPPPPEPVQHDERTNTKTKSKQTSEYSLESDDEDDPEKLYDDIIEPADTPAQSPNRSTVHGAAAFAEMASSPPGTSKKPIVGGVSILGPLSPTSVLLPKAVKKPVKQRYSSVSIPENPPPQLEHQLPDYLNDGVFKRETYYFDSSDRDEADRLLQRKPKGTFLVRRSRSGTEDVLCVMTPQGYKEFKLQIMPDSKITLNRVATFPTLDALLCYYYTNPLPKNEYTIKLAGGYKM